MLPLPRDPILLVVLLKKDDVVKDRRPGVGVKKDDTGVELEQLDPVIRFEELLL